jgi:hypothetical protein
VQLSAATFTLPYQLTMTLNAAQLSAGSYSTNVTINCPGAAIPSATIAVAMLVTAPAPAQISLSQSNLSVTLKAGNNGLIQPVAVSNPGGGAYQFTVTAATQNGGNWLSAVLIKDSVSFSSPGQMQITLNPTGLAAGSYLGSVTVQAPAATEPTKTIPVTLTVAPADKGVISLAQSAVNFTAVAGTSSVVQEVGVLNAGSGIMNWTATGRTLSGGNWLTVTPATGTSDAGQVLVPTISVRTSAVGLTAGEYVGVVEVAAANTTNLSELVTVRLTVLPAGTPAEPSATPTGLIFIGTAGQNDAGLQTVKLWNEETSAIAYQSGLLGGDNWLTTSPATGTVAGGSAATGPGSANLVLQSNFTSLPVGINRAVMTVFFPASGVARTVRVTSIGRATASADPGAGPGPSASESAKAPGKLGQRAVSCASSSLIAVLRNLSSGFSVRAGVGQPIEALIYDSCGNAVTAGTVTLQASHELNGISLVSLKDGRWSGTWTPSAVSGATATSVQLVIASGGLTGALDSPVTGTVQPGLNCVFSFTSANPAAVAVGGGTGSVLVSATNGSCVRTAVSNASWLRVTSGDLAVGSGSVAFTADANSGAGTRTGVLTIGGQTFTVNQAGGSPSQPISVSPASGSTGRQVFTFVSRHSSSANSILYSQVLFSKNGLNAANGCYISYDPAGNVFYLLSDDVSTWYGLLGGSPNKVGNSQCTIHGATSGSSKSGTDLTITIDVSFRTSFGGTKAVYLLAGDSGGAVSSWQQVGTRSDTGDTQVVELISLTPSSGSGGSVTFTSVVKDSDGATTIPFTQFVMNAGLNGYNACFIHFDRASNAFFLLKDDASGWFGLLGGTTGQVANSQCVLSGTGSGGTASGDTLTVTYNLQFKSGFAGSRQIYMQAVDNTGVIQSWKQMGSWTVSGTTLASASGPAPMESRTISRKSLGIPATPAFESPKQYRVIRQGDVLMVGSEEAGLATPGSAGDSKRNGVEKE